MDHNGTVYILIQTARGRNGTLNEKFCEATILT